MPTEEEKKPKSENNPTRPEKKGDSKEKPKIDAEKKTELENTRAELSKSEKSLEDSRAHNKAKLTETIQRHFEKNIAGDMLSLWVGPIGPKKLQQASDVSLFSKAYEDIDQEGQKKITEAEGKYMDAFRKAHTAEIHNIVQGKKMGDIDPEIRKSVYDDFIKSSLGDKSGIETKVDLQIEELKKKFAKLKPDEQKKKLAELDKSLQKTKDELRQTIINKSLSDTVSKIDELQNEKIEETAKAEIREKLKKGLKESLGLDESKADELIKKLLEEKQVKEQIAKKITEKGIVASGVNIESVLGKELHEKQKESLESVMRVMGDSINPELLPLDIKQRLILENESANNPHALIDSEKMPDALGKQISRMRREIFRQKPGESDADYIKNTDTRLKDKAGVSMQELSNLRGQMSPLVRFILDLIAPLGCMMPGKTGERFRNYVRENGTPEQQRRWAESSGKYYGKEGGEVPASNRESNKKNLTDYAGCTNRELMPTVDKIRANKSKYQAVSEKLKQKTGGKKNIPWEAIAAIHYREGDMNFRTYLHNGDRLGSPTVRVPAGILFPDTAEGWIDAAVDALNRESYINNMNTNSIDGLANIAEYSERFNGSAYRKQGKNSPYVWAGSKGIGVAGLIKVDHGPITNEQDRRLGIMPIVLELAGYTSGGQMNDEQKKKLSSSPNETTETAGKNPVQWFKNEAEKNTGYGKISEGKYDCMTSTNTALGFPWEHHAKAFNSQHILGKDEKGNDTPQNLWNVSMAAAIYTGKINGPTSESSKDNPIKKEDGWYGGPTKANDIHSMEYYIEENVAKRVNEDSKGFREVGGDQNFVHYSKKKGIPFIVEDIKKRLQNGECAMMGATGTGTNLGGHEWLITREGDNLLVYEATGAIDEATGKPIGVSGTGVELSKYLGNIKRRGNSKNANEAIIFAKSNRQILTKKEQDSPKISEKSLSGTALVGDSHFNYISGGKGFNPYGKKENRKLPGSSNVDIPTVISGGNSGETGYSVSQLIDRSEGQDYIRGKKNIVVCLGTNDATIYSPPQMVANMTQLVTKIRSINPDGKIILVTPPRNLNTAVDGKIANYVSLLKQFPESENNFQIADFYTYSKYKDMPMSDNDHLTPSGYREMQDFITRYLS